MQNGIRHVRRLILFTPAPAFALGALSGGNAALLPGTGVCADGRLSGRVAWEAGAPETV
jgi:hypothetical protein